MSTTVELQAGPEMDAEIARRVFGISVVWFEEEPYEWFPEASPCGSVPPYSTYIAAAWLVVEKVRERFGTVSIETSDGTWSCTIANGYDYGGDFDVVYGYCLDTDTAPLAICRAALAALDGPTA